MSSCRSLSRGPASCLLLMQCALFGATASFAQDRVWVDENKQPLPDTDARKSDKGFGASLVVTPDADWQDKWYSASQEDAPRFSEADSVKVGETLTILGFFTNPGLTAEGEASIGCAIKVVRPDASVSLDQEFPCFEGVLAEDPRLVYMLPTAIKYVGEASDPPGRWVIEFTVSDRVRQAVVPLRTSFTLQKAD